MTKYILEETFVEILDLIHMARIEGLSFLHFESLDGENKYIDYLLKNEESFVLGNYGIEYSASRLGDDRFRSLTLLFDFEEVV